MAVIPAVIDSSIGIENALSVTWTEVTDGDTCEPYSFSKLAQAVSVHVTGTFGSATVVFAQSNVVGVAGPDAVDLDGATISITAAALTEIRDRSRIVTPEHSGGGGTQDLDISMVVLF